MEQMSCLQEIAVSKSAVSGEWDESLRQHAAICPVCREALQAALWMQSLAQAEISSATVPDPSIVWQRARLSELLAAKQAKVQASLRLAKYIEAASVALVLLTITSWVAWNWQSLDSVIDWLSSMVLTTTYEIVSATPIAFWSTIGVFSLITAGLVYRLIAID